MTPLVSIVTPAFKAAEFLPALLDSVAAQDYPRIEHIVIDDGSPDDGATARVLERYPAVRWWSRPNRGQYATLNEGFHAATGDYVTTISADDVYCDAGSIRALAECLTHNTGCDVAYGFTRHVQSDLTPFAVQPYQRHPAWMLRYHLGFIFHCSLLVRRHVLIRDQLCFNESFKYIGDADWMARMVAHGYRFCRVDRFIAAYRHHESQASTTASRDEAADARRQQEHAIVAATLRQNSLIKALVLSFDTMQQRRVKLLGAAQQGGAVGVGHLARNWWRRRSHGR